MERAREPHAETEQSLRDVPTRQGGPRTPGSAQHSEREGRGACSPADLQKEPFHFHCLWALILGAQGSYIFIGTKVGMTRQNLRARALLLPPAHIVLR